MGNFGQSSLENRPRKNNEGGLAPSDTESLHGIKLEQYETEHQFLDALAGMGSSLEKITAADFKWTKKMEDALINFKEKHQKGLKKLGLSLLGAKLFLSGLAGVEQAKAEPVFDRSEAKHEWRIGDSGDSDASTFKIEGGGGEPGGPINVDISKYFKTGTFEYENPNDRIEAVSFLVGELNRMDIINADISEVVIEGSASGDRGHADNPGLAQGRAEEGKRVFIDALMQSTKYSADEKAKIIAGIKVVRTVKFLTADEKVKLSVEEQKRLLDSYQGAKVSVVAKQEQDPPFAPASEPVPEGRFNIQESDLIVLDQSASMKRDADLVTQQVEKIKAESGKDIKIVTLEGGNEEAHLQTLLTILNKSTTLPGSKILVITDEPDNRYMNGPYETNIGYVLGKARDMKITIIVRMLNPNGSGEYKDIVLNTHRNALRQYDANGKLLTPTAWYNAS